MIKTYFYIGFVKFNGDNDERFRKICKKHFPRGKFIAEKGAYTVRVNTADEARGYCYTEARNYKEFRQKEKENA